MKSKAKVVVVGGGVVGVSALYHLAKKRFIRCCSCREKRINFRINLACSRPASIIQYELFGWTTS